MFKFLFSFFHLLNTQVGIDSKHWEGKEKLHFNKF